MKFNICVACGKRLGCLQEGISERENCPDFQPLSSEAVSKKLSTEEQLAATEFMESLMVGSCPECGSKEVTDCRHEPAIDDICVGACLACGIHWCLECGYVFKKEERKRCPHWEFCGVCSAENGYLTLDEFMEKVCPTCEHYDEGCRLEDPSKCDKESQLRCPYEAAPSECPKFGKYLKEPG